MIYLKRIWDIIERILDVVITFSAVVVFVVSWFVICFLLMVTAPLVVALAVLELFITAPVYYVATGERYYGNFNSILAVWASVPDFLEDGIVGFRKKKST
jgi:hypothetical protein